MKREGSGWMKAVTTNKSIPDQVFSSLLEAISSGEFAVGAKLPSEHELASAFGVSRPSVKTALDRLNTLGIVEQKVGKGTFVKAPSISAFLEQYGKLFVDTNNSEELLSLRHACELEGCRKMTLSSTTDSEMLLKYYKELVKAVEEEDDRKIEHSAFLLHDCFCQASDNRLLLQLYPFSQEMFKQWLHEHLQQLIMKLPVYQILCEAVVDHRLDSLKYLAEIHAIE